MPIRIGSGNNQSEVNVGGVKMAKVYLGSTLVWEKATNPAKTFRLLWNAENSTVLTTYELAVEAAFNFYTDSARWETNNLTGYGLTWEVDDVIYADSLGETVVPDGYYVYMGSLDGLPIIYQVIDGIIVFEEKQYY